MAYARQRLLSPPSHFLSIALRQAKGLGGNTTAESSPRTNQCCGVTRRGGIICSRYKRENLLDTREKARANSEIALQFKRWFFRNFRFYIIFRLMALTTASDFE